MFEGVQELISGHPLHRLSGLRERISRLLDEYREQDPDEYGEKLARGLTQAIPTRLEAATDCLVLAMRYHRSLEPTHDQLEMAFILQKVLGAIEGALLHTFSSLDAFARALCVSSQGIPSPKKRIYFKGTIERQKWMSIEEHSFLLHFISTRNFRYYHALRNRIAHGYRIPEVILRSDDQIGVYLEGHSLVLTKEASLRRKRLEMIANGLEEPEDGERFSLEMMRPASDLAGFVDTCGVVLSDAIDLRYGNPRGF